MIWFERLYYVLSSLYQSWVVFWTLALTLIGNFDKDFFTLVCFFLWLQSALQRIILIQTAPGAFSSQQFWCKLTQNWTFISFGSNSLSGRIPNDFFNCSSLRTLDLAENKLTGSLSPRAGALESLLIFQLQGNSLSGNILQEIGNLSRLYQLKLGRNKFKGQGKYLGLFLSSHRFNYLL